MKLLTTKEVAETLSLHEVTVRNKCRNGEIPCFKIGRSWKVKEEDFIKWIDEQQANS